MLLSLEVLS